VTAAVLTEVEGSTKVGPLRNALAEPTKVGADGVKLNVTFAVTLDAAETNGIEIPLSTSVDMIASVARVVLENFIFSI